MRNTAPGAVLRAVKRGRGGVHVAYNKMTAELDTVRIPVPEKVVIPMSQHIGSPCVPTVKVGDTVKVGQLIGDSDKPLATPIHASVSGRVSSVAPVTLHDGSTLSAVTIESDGEMAQWEGIEPPKVESREDLIAAVRASGLVGLGGAGFPTYVKLNWKPTQNVDTLVVNAAECEPYITADYRECIENSYDILSGVYTLQEFLGFKNIIIAVEDNKPDAIEILKRVADHDNDKGDAIKLMTLRSIYPQGAEKMMVLSATGRVVPAGGLPADVGCVVMNVASVAFVARYLKTGKPLVSRTVTVSGDAVVSPKNVRAPVGISVGELFDFCGGFREQPYKLIAGGPMMGFAMVDTDGPLLKKNNALLAFSRTSEFVKPLSDCIRCGKCHSVCPMNLVPTNLMNEARLKKTDALSAHGVMNCMECGCCAYTCPAGIPLVQYLRLGKALVREGAKK
ncbi:MAG: electron transport complex subunit RsxC [Clostridia bacterium]|nr:electron transport complex subunit RsxC [Clostridia bacterium]